MRRSAPADKAAAKRRARRRRLNRLRLTVLAVLLLVASPWLLDGFWRWRYPYHYRTLIESQAAAFELDPLLVAAVIRVESQFDPQAVSGAGARGLMQLMPTTAVWVAEQQGLARPTHEDLYQPELNVRLGCWYLRYLLKRHVDVAEALAAYNGGEGNVAKWRRDGAGIPFPETRSYVQRSLYAYERYRTLYGEK